MLLPIPICESCWLEKYSKWEPESMDESGHMLMRLVDVQMPKKYNLDEPEICADCESLTVAGIFEVSVNGEGLMPSDFASSFAPSGSYSSDEEDLDGGYEDDSWGYDGSEE
jgi:hypothetical protein